MDGVKESLTSGLTSFKKEAKKKYAKLTGEFVDPSLWQGVCCENARNHEFSVTLKASHKTASPLFFVSSEASKLHWQAVLSRPTVSRETCLFGVLMETVFSARSAWRNLMMPALGHSWKTVVNLNAHACLHIVGTFVRARTRARCELRHRECCVDSGVLISQLASWNRKNKVCLKRCRKKWVRL